MILGSSPDRFVQGSSFCRKDSGQTAAFLLGTKKLSYRGDRTPYD